MTQDEAAIFFNGALVALENMPEDRFDAFFDEACKTLGFNVSRGCTYACKLDWPPTIPGGSNDEPQ
jgi:hypothetical protein